MVLVTIWGVMTILFGLLPSLHATRPSLTAALKDGVAESPSRRPVLRRLTTRNLLVVVELALALVLLAGSGVMTRSLANLIAVNPGFEPAKVLPSPTVTPELLMFRSVTFAVAPLKSLLLTEPLVPLWKRMPVLLS